MSYPCILYGGECDGCGKCQGEEKKYYCPICGEEVDGVYVSNDGEVVGCENCVTLKDIWDVMDE